MYKIKNISKGKVIIGDLGIVFAHEEEKDLDDLFPRATVEASQNLKAAIYRYKKLSHPDISDVKPHETVTYFVQSPASVAPNITEDQLAAMEKRIRSQLENLVVSQSPNPGDANQQLQHKLDLIIKSLSTGGITKNTTDTNNDMEVGIDDDKLVDIQMKALNRLTKNAEGQIASKQEQKSSDVSKRAEELDGLL